MAAPVAAPSRLWTANFTLYFTGRMASLYADAMMPVALSVGMLSMGYGVGAVGFALGAWMATFALFVIFGGVFADRFHPRPLMIGADAARMVLLGGLAAWFWLDRPPLWFILAICALGGLATAMFQPGVNGLVPQVTSDPQKANGIVRIGQGVSGMAGPAMAGALVAFAPVAVAFAVTALTFAVSGLSLAALRLPPFSADRSESTWANLRTGWWEFRSRTWLWAVILIWWVQGVFVSGPIIPLGAASIIAEHGSAAFGYAEGAFGIGSVIGGLVAIRMRPRRPLFGGGIAMFLFPMMPLAAALVPAQPILFALYAIAGAGWTFWGVQWSTSVQTQIPEDRLNRVTAYEVAGSIVAIPFGQAIAGPASDLIGLHRFLAIATVVGLGCAVALVSIRPIRELSRV